MSVVTSSNSGDIAWLIASTALVMLMTPALGFFYGGLVRKKNLISTIVQCVAIFAVISIIWALWGYSLVFGNSIGGVIGDLSLLGLNSLSIQTVNPLLAAPFLSYCSLRFS
jgi:Amt family ammonium transporter